MLIHSQPSTALLGAHVGVRNPHKCEPNLRGKSRLYSKALVMWCLRFVLLVPGAVNAIRLSFEEGHTVKSPVWKPQLNHLTRSRRLILMGAMGRNLKASTAASGWAPLEDLARVLACAWHIEVVLPQS